MRIGNMTFILFLNYNVLMELPFWCSACGSEVMVDMDRLDTRPVSGLTIAKGFLCGQCGKWNARWFVNPQTLRNLEKLERMNPFHTSFGYLFNKSLKRVQALIHSQAVI